MVISIVRNLFCFQDGRISSLGTEPFGLFDVSVAGIQVVIVATSLYLQAGKIYTKGMTVGK